MIALKLRVVLIVVSLLILIYVLYKIRKSKLNIADSIYWVIFSVLLLILSIFPQISYFCARLMGIEAPLSFLILFFIGIVVLKQFLLTIKLSNLMQKNKELAQKIAISEYDKEAHNHE